MPLSNSMVRIVLGALVALHLGACGAASSGPAQRTAAVGPAGATLQVGSALLSIPAGALPTSTAITLRETEPQHPGRAKRFEIEPHGLPLSVPAQLVVTIEAENVKPRLHGDDDQLVAVEVEDRAHGRFKTTLDPLGAVEIELEPGQACTPACDAGQECDDGTCKAHLEDDGARTCDPVCASGQECDDGACKAHGDLAAAGAASCAPTCATDLECDDGICVPHRRGDG